MHTAPIHLSEAELEQGMPNVLDSPQDKGCLHAVYIRLAAGERGVPPSVMLSPEDGVEGDRWATNHWQKLPDGRPNPQSQVSLMNARILRLIAGSEEAMCLSGDNLIVDLDLSEANLPAGSRLRIGDVAVLEMTSQSHTGCGSFSLRFGQDARAFINGPRGKPLNLRGRFARVVEAGTIAIGDTVAKV